MLNRVILVGRVATDPEVRYTANGHPVCRFRIAVPRRVRRNGNGNGNNEADFFPVVTWGKEAEIASRYLQKGRLVAVEGRLASRSYEAGGRIVRVVEIIGNVRFLDRPKAPEAAPEPELPQEEAFPEEIREETLPPEEEEEEDVPF